MQLPRLNLNGTNAKDLVEQHARAHALLGDALDALCAARPHGRDYQTLEAGAYQRARDEHEARIDAVTTVRGEILELAMKIQEQDQ